MVSLARHGHLPHRPVWKVYVLAFIVTGIAVLLRWLLDPILGSTVPYISIFPAIIACAWYFGTGPAILSSALGVLAAHFLFFEPRHTLRISGSAELVQVFFFIAVAAFMVLISDRNRRTVNNLDALNATLEARVQERTAELRSQTSELTSRTRLLDMANDAVFAIRNGKIVYWNRGAERLYGWTRDEATGQEPHALLQSHFPMPREEIVEQLQREGSWIGDITQTRRDGAQIAVASNWSIWRDENSDDVGWLEINTDVTQRKRAEESLRELTGRLLRMQDDERRRIARELHDSTGQMLVALAMNLSSLEPESPKLTAQSSQVLSDSQKLVQEMTREVRTLSYLLHPPLLDEAGLNSALRWYVEGFSKRSHVVVDLQLDSAVGRLPREIETAIFRIVQESLTNVHRHSGSSFAEIRLDRQPSSIRVEVQDEGKGIAPDKVDNPRSSKGLGVGITGMRERVRQLGGGLEIVSNGSGTLIRAELPIPDALSSKVAPGEVGPVPS